MEFKEILKARRKELGLTQQDIADLFGIKAVNVSDWERGIFMPEAGRLLKLAKRLGLNVSQLLGELPIANESASHEPPPSKIQWTTESESTLLSLFRETDDSGRLTILNVASAVPKRTH